MIDLVLHNRTRRRGYGRAFFVRVCDVTEPYLHIPRRFIAEVGITLVGSTAMRTINKTRRGVDKATDVLSFPLHMKPITGYTAVLLGDVFICPAIAHDRMAWATVHGLLHLAGYDHEKSASAAAKMTVIEKRILRTLLMSKF